MRSSSFLVIGMLSLTAAIMLHRYTGSNSVTDFIEGLLFGISIGTNLLFLIRQRKNNEN